MLSAFLPKLRSLANLAIARNLKKSITSVNSQFTRGTLVSLVPIVLIKRKSDNNRTGEDEGSKNETVSIIRRLLYRLERYLSLERFPLTT